jgi:hypothetical protein
VSNLPDSGPQRNVRSLLPALSNIDFALNAADRGFVPFPLGVNSAEPAFDEGDALATKSKVMLRHWWEENPRYNVGFSLENLLTLRINSARCAPSTLTLLGALLIERGVPSSVKTTRIVSDAPAAVEVCVHFLLPDDATVEARSDVLFEGVDVLSSDDFVVGPGSMIDGYLCEFVGDNALSLATPWLLEACGVQLADHEEDITPAATIVKTVAPSIVTEEITAPKDVAPLVATGEAAALPTESKTVTNVIPMKKAATVGAVGPKQVRKTKLDWALEAAQHVPVHPCRWYVDPGPDATPKEREKAIKAAKAPLLHDWPNRATQDPEQIRTLWDEYPDANIGGVTNQLLVLDVDKRHGGCETFEFLRLVEDFPETMTSNTQGGGQHMFYVLRAGEPFKNGTHKLGSGIDVKTDGGYVLMPGSTIEGRMYTRANNAPIAFAPGWIVEQCKNAKPKSSAAGKRIVEEDEISLQLAAKYLEKYAPRATTGKIDDTTFEVMARLYDFGCTQETVHELGLGWNETHCDPPGDIDRLAVVVESAGKNRERAIGCSHPLAPGFEAHEIDESKAPPPIAKIGCAGAWENEPNAIFVDHLKPADLPAGVLPELVEQFARDRAHRLGVDAGAPAAALVTALGSLVPAGNRLQMRQLDTEWTVKPILWTAIIGPPGSNKSATINAAMGPVQKLQGAWRKSFAADEHKRKADETRRATVEKASKAKPENTDQVFEGEPEAAKPRFRQKIYNDATTEALAVALCENPEGLLYHADELAGWLAGMDAYRTKGGKDRAFWLQAKEGGDFTVNRKLSERICVENCAISVLGGIQPDKIRALKLGMSDDGLLQRFTPIVIHRSGNGADIAPDTATGERLATAANSIADAANGRLFRYSPEADAELHAVEAFKAKEIARPDASPTLRQWLDKMPNEFGRLSLVFHFIEHHGDAGASGDTLPAIIGRGTAERARRYLTEFVYSHALTFYLKDLGASTMDEHALWIAGFALARGLPAISSRDIYRVYPALKSPEKRSLIVATMRVLEMHDWVKPAHVDRHGVEDRWTVNPAVHDGRFSEIAAAERSRRDDVQERIKLGAAT